jgi:hypothetical protein
VGSVELALQVADAPDGHRLGREDRSGGRAPASGVRGDHPVDRVTYRGPHGEASFLCVRFETDVLLVVEESRAGG